MRRFLILTALLLITGAAAKAAPPARTMRLPLTHIRPSEFMTILTEAMPPGLESVAPNDPEKRLIVRGTAAGISEVRRLIRLLDVPARTVRVNLRLERSLPGKNNASRTEVLSTVQTSAVNNASFPVTFRTADGECIAVLKPRINGDTSVTFETTLSLRRIQSTQGATRYTTMQGTRRVRPGQWERLLSLSAPAGTYTLSLETPATPAPLLRPKIVKGVR